MNYQEKIEKEVNSIVNLLKIKNYDEAIRKGSALIKLLPSECFLYNVVALAHNGKNEFYEALKILENALKLEPTNISVLNNLGLVNSNLNNYEKAEYYLKRALNINPKFIDALVNLGNVKLKIGQILESKKNFEEALLVNKKLEPAILSLANLYQQDGNFEKAINCYEELLKLNPKNTIADKSISLIKKYKDNDKHLLAMEEKIKNLTNFEDKIRLNFALGKAYNDINNFKKAFNHYKAGNDLKSDEIKYNLKIDKVFFEKIKKFFTSKNISKVNSPFEQLIFIVGMPRSGTTLVEQILSSHKEVYGAGELPFLTDVIKSNFIDNNEFIYNDISNTDEDILKKAQGQYLDKIKIFNHKKKYLSDKAPLNFKWIGFIKEIFPNSKIIHCCRDKMDICWSNYQNSFSSNELNFTYNLTTLGKYYNLYEDLMVFWSNKFNNSIYNVNYEELINADKPEIKKLLDFCNLSWDSNCLEFYKNNKSVATASLAQVREPLYKTSIKKWEKYSEELGELKKEFNNL